MKKKFLQALVGRKKYMQHKYNRKLMGKKREKNILPTRLLEKKRALDSKTRATTKASFSQF